MRLPAWRPAGRRTWRQRLVAVSRRRRSPRSGCLVLEAARQSDSKWSCNRFPAPVHGHGSTELYGPLATAPAKFKNLVGVVLISDGDWNAGLPPVEAATLLRLKGRSGSGGAGGQARSLARRRSPQPGCAHLCGPRQIGASPLYDRELSAPRLRDQRRAAHVQRGGGVQRSPDRGHGGHPRLAGMEAGGAGRRDADTGSAAAPRRNADGQQSA